jgi:uncharacterized protein (DUF849 family)
MLLQAVLNGARPAGAHRALPLTPEEQAAAAVASVVAGAGAIHAHARPRLLHGTEATAWPLLDEAARRGYHARIGLEDTLTLPDGTLAGGNGALVLEARKRLDRSP